MTDQLSNPDSRVSVPVDLSKDEWYELMLLAHERDITLNQFVEQVLMLAIKEAEEKNSNIVD